MSRRLSSSGISNGRRAASRDTSREAANTSKSAAPSAKVSPPQGTDAPFWRATADTVLYSAPQGRVVGDVSAGTVVEEETHVHDYFGDMWVATNASDETIVWVKAVCVDGESNWEFVVDTASANQPIPSPPRSRNSSQFPFTYDFNSLATESSVRWITEYVQKHLRSGPLAGGVRDWNEEYQCIVEELVFNDLKGTASEETTTAIRKKLEDLAGEFVDHVDNAVISIVREMAVPQAERTIPSFGGRCGVYIHKNVFYKLCIDSTGGVFGGDSNAMKIASCIRRTHNALAGVAPLHLLSMPLMTVMTYCGYRVMATSIPPILAESIVSGYGFPPTGVEHSVVSKLSTSLRDAVRLKPHGPNNKLGLPFDCSIYAGLDGRLYLMNIGRFLPPLAPPPAAPASATFGANYFPQTTSLYRRLRPEAAASLESPCNPDAFVPKLSSPEDNAEVINVTNCLNAETIPTVAAMLGFLEACPDISPQTSCVNCQKGISSQELRFVACRSDSKCCCLCMQCHVNATTAKDTEKFYTKLKSQSCGSGLLPVKGFIMQPDVTALFHACGLNLRFLSYVHQRIPSSARGCTAHYLEVEMIGRAAKHLLWKALRRTQSEEEVSTVCANFFFCLLRPDGARAEQFWAEELGPAIQSMFEVFVAFDTAELDIESVYRRFSQLTGVELSPDSVASFYTEKPFVQLARPHTVMKWIHLPYICEKAGEQGMTLKTVFDDELKDFWNQRRAACLLWTVEPKMRWWLH